MESSSGVDASQLEGEIEIGSTSAQAHMQVVLSFWKEFNLDGRRLQLDKQGLELQDARDGSLGRRKNLAELTKDFRKKPDHEKVSEVQRLVKAYQEEIDSLAKRCRSSDSAFFSLYKALYEAPDPAQALERSASQRPRAAASQLEVQKLQAELAEYEEEFSKLKNQDITIRRLEGVIEGYQEGAETRAEDEVAARVKVLEEAAEARVEMIREQEGQLEKSLQDSENLLSEAREVAEAMESRLFESSRRAQEAEAAWEVEREILSQTNEAAQVQLARVEQELQDLRMRERNALFSSAGDSEPGVGGAAEAARAGAAPGGGLAGGGRLGALGGVGHAEAIEAELDELTRVNSQLRGEMVVKSASWGEEKGALERALTSARESLSGASAEAATLRKDLVGRPAMSEVRSLKQQVRALQQLEFNGGNDDEDDGGGGATTGGGDEPHGADPEDTASHVERTMEQVIKSRVRRLEADLTSSRRLAEELKADNAKLQLSLDESLALAAERLGTVNRLEDDLTSAFRGASPSVGVGGGGVGISSDFTPGRRGPGTAGGFIEGPEGSQALRELLGVEGGGDGGRGGRGGGGGGEVDHGVLGIVQAQRDRFRRRIKELEAEREEEQREARGAQGVMENLQKDNLQLYEKVRFLQSYQRRSPSATGEAGRALPEDVEIGGGVSGGRGQGLRKASSPTEARYGQMYEARMNPFTQFSQRERQRKYRDLTTVEKITLSTTRLFIGSRFARNFTFFYVVFLHLVVFFTLSYWTHSTRSNCNGRPGMSPDP